MGIVTYMSTEAIDGLVKAIEDKGEHVPLELNTADAVALVKALKLAYDELPGRTGEEESLADWVGDLLSGLASTYGLAEWV